MRSGRANLADRAQRRAVASRVQRSRSRRQGRAAMQMAAAALDAGCETRRRGLPRAGGAFPHEARDRGPNKEAVQVP